MRIDNEDLPNLKIKFAIRNTPTYGVGSRYIGEASDPNSMVHMNGARLYASYGEAKFVSDRIMEAFKGHYLYVVRMLVREDAS